MKIILWGFLFTTIFLLSCNGDHDFATEPPVSSQLSLSNESITELRGFEQLITLPPKSPLFRDSVFSVSKIIQGDEGGTVSLQKYYISTDGDSITIDAYLHIRKNSFVGTETITMTVDSEYAAIQFYPAMNFIKPLLLSQKFSGLNLQGIPTGTIDFIFVNDNGTFEPVEKNMVQVVGPQGIVRVMNARLEHFSRYGWVR